MGVYIELRDVIDLQRAESIIVLKVKANSVIMKKKVFNKTQIHEMVRSFHPYMLFAATYILALLFSVFVCISIFNRYNNDSSLFREDRISGVKKTFSPGYKEANTILVIK